MICIPIPRCMNKRPTPSPGPMVSFAGIPRDCFLTRWLKSAGSVKIRRQRGKMRTGMKQIYAILPLMFGLIAAPAQAEIINLSCDDGGMLLLIDTGKATVSDKNPFQKTEVTVALKITDTAYAWREV